MAALSSLFYHWGILQRVVRAVAWVMRKAMGTSGSETLSAAANIFMGQTEAPLVIRPYVPRMTRSEIMTIMVCGMAHIAGGVAAVYAAMGMAAGYPNTAGHLLTASVLNCPAALLIAKIMLPETEKSETAGTSPATVPRTTANSIDAICRGAGDGFHLALNICAMLIAFIAIIALANYVVGFPQTHFGVKNPVTLQNIFGWVNAPFAWLMGVPAQDCLSVGQILGERIVLNEFVGYLDLTGQRERTGARPAQFHHRDLRAVRLREFFQHRDPGRRHRLARAGTPQRNGQARFPRDDRRPARRLHDRVARGIFAVNFMPVTLPQLSRREFLKRAALAGAAVAFAPHATPACSANRATNTLSPFSPTRTLPPMPR